MTVPFHPGITTLEDEQDYRIAHGMKPWPAQTSRRTRIMVDLADTLSARKESREIEEDTVRRLLGV